MNNWFKRNWVYIFWAVFFSLSVGYVIFFFIKVFELIIDKL